MERKMGIITFLNVMSAWNQVPTIELVDKGGLLRNVVPSRTKVATYKDGENIGLTRTFLNTEWKYIENHQTFAEAYNEARSQNQSQIVGLLGDRYEFSYIGGGVESMPISALTGFNISFKDLVEGKMWDTYSGWSSPLDGEQASSPTEPRNFNFTETVENLLGASIPHYMIQFNTGKKIYLDTEGIKDASTKQIIELDASLYLSGAWYVGEDVAETGGGNMTLTEAVSKVDWQTQDLVFLAGTNKEFRIYGANQYSEFSLYSTIPENIRKTETVHSILFANSWSLAPAYTGA